MSALRPLMFSVVVLTAAVLSVAGLMSAASGAPAATGLRFTVFPKVGVPGKSTKVVVSGPQAKDVCSLSVQYAGGTSQHGLRSIRVGASRPSWVWRIPANAQAGTARISVSCKAAGRISGQLSVQPLPLRIDVLKQGFSVKAVSSRATVSYGVVLANRSKTYDALHVSVLVNFVMANNVLIGSVTENIDTIPAGSEYRLGDYTTFPGAAPVARLEVVVHAGDRQLALRTPVPAISNIRIVADQHEPDWIGEVQADLANVSQNRVLTGARIKVVVLNAAGDIVGGGSLSMSATLPPGARQFVKVTSGVDSVAMADASSALVTVEPRYESG